MRDAQRGPRRRRRRLVRTVIRGASWLLLLTAVFVLGIGYGRTVVRPGTDEKVRTVKITGDRGTVSATLPTRTITVTKTRTVRARADRSPR